MVVGIGNPIMGDDGVGIHILRRLREKIPRTDVDFKEIGVGGIKLVEEILDYKTVIIIDSIESSNPPGSINEFSPEQFSNTYHEAAPHDVNFITALELYKRLQQDRIPKTIRIFTIAIQNQWTFKSDLSPSIQVAAARLTELLINELKETRKGEI